VCEREIVHRYVCVLMCVCIYTQVRRTQGKAAKAEQAMHRYLHTHYAISKKAGATVGGVHRFGCIALCQHQPPTARLWCATSACATRAPHVRHTLSLTHKRM